jgi:hypothetical protein
MADQSTSSGTDSSLPKALVLSYVASTESPTRVRQLTARTLRIIGGLMLLTATLLFCVLTHSFWQMYREYVAVSVRWRALGLGPYIFRDAAYNWGTDTFPALIALAATICLGVTQTAVAGPVFRARKAGCVVAFLSLVPPMLAIGFTTACAAGLALVVGAGVGATRARPLNLLWLLTMPIGILLVLLLKDLMGYLRWIARNPITEKLPVRFLP